MTEIKKEEGNIFSDDFKKNVKKVWDWIFKNIKKFWNWISSVGVKRIIGMGIVLIAGISAFVEFLGYLFVLLDLEKFSEIIKYFYNLNIFDYIELNNFYLMAAGGFLLDVFFYGITILFGVWLWKNKNYFKKKSLGWILLIIFPLGLGLFGYGFYQSMPGIMVPLEKIIQEDFDDFDRFDDRHDRGHGKLIFGNGLLEVGFDKNKEEEFFKYIESKY